MINTLSRRVALSALRALSRATDDGLAISENGTYLLGDDQARAQVVINDRRAYTAMSRGSLAAADAYTAGWWDSPDLPALMLYLAENIDGTNRIIDRAWHQWPNYLYRLATRAQMRFFPRQAARRHIGAHYDLSNDFFALFLDRHMAYSCAVYPSPTATLAEAQQHKMELICDKLALTADDYFLDLGCGWGGLACYAAQTRDCQTTALTLSRAQHQHLQTRLAHSTTPARVTAVYRDYRDFVPPQKFSKLSSVEMIEAVGPDKFNEYFRTIRALLVTGGRAVIQAILIPQQRQAAAARTQDFINTRIFPGGALPSTELITKAAAQAGLHLRHREYIGKHYPPTLAAWRHRFYQQQERINALGFDRSFCRTWDYYFCYCMGGFGAGAIDVAQFVFDAK